MRNRHARRSNLAPELNITAFLNLMVILVPFLLMTAVFSHLTILDLNLPSAKDNKSSGGKKPKFDLKIVIRNNDMLVSDGRRIIKNISYRKGQHDYELLSKVIQKVKASYPDKRAITILSQQTTPYNNLIQVMDAVRSVHVMQKGTIVEAELFPEISIGDAPR